MLMRGGPMGGPAHTAQNAPQNKATGQKGVNDYRETQGTENDGPVSVNTSPRIPALPCTASTLFRPLKGEDE